jgi:hypothetical protein
MHQEDRQQKAEGVLTDVDTAMTRPVVRGTINISLLLLLGRLLLRSFLFYLLRSSCFPRPFNRKVSESYRQQVSSRDTIIGS